MEIALEKKNLSDMNLIQAIRWELRAIQTELRGLQAAIGGYPMKIDRLTNEIQLLENKDFSVALDFKVSTEVTDNLKSLEIERKRFLEAQATAQQKISELKAQNQREIERIKSQLDTYKTERLTRHKRDKERIKELLKKEKELTDRLNGFVILDVRPVLNDN